jgi:hypothetical protein
MRSHHGVHETKTVALVCPRPEYQVTVGWVANRRINNMAVAAAPTMEELRDEISAEDLDAIILDVADSIKERRKAELEDCPPLPLEAVTEH